MHYLGYKKLILNLKLYPCRTNIVEAHVQIQSLVKAEYSPEEQSIINMTSIQNLQAELDNLL
jgi:hypothetical protein